jgi:hypothetical protein
MSSNGGTPTLFVNIYTRTTGGVETLIASNTSVPHPISEGTLIELYLFSVPVPTTSLALTDTIVVKFYARNLGGKTMTLRFEDTTISQVITSLSPALQGPQGITGPQGEVGPTGPVEPITLNEIAFGTGTGLTSSPLFQVIPSAGSYNTLSATSYKSSIIGGYTNAIDTSEGSSIIGGGQNNILSTSVDSAIIGSRKSNIDNSDTSLILGSVKSNINTTSVRASIISGNTNLIKYGAFSSTIGGGYNELCSSNYSSIISGSYNTITLSSCSSIIGGHNNTLSNYSSGSVIIGGIGLTLSSEAEVVYVPKLKIATASNIEASRVLVWDTDNYVKYREASTLGLSTTGTASIEFEDLLYGALEVPEGRVLVNDANVLLTSTINIIVGTSSDHDSIEDAVYEDLNFKYEIESAGQFTIYGYAPLDTHGVWNLIYRVIN